MRPLRIAFALTLLAAAAPAARAAPAMSPAQAIAEPARPEADRARDAARNPEAALVFIGVEAGSRVAERFPGDGYWSRLLAAEAGPGGRLYMLLDRGKDGKIYDLDKARPVAAALPNATLVQTPITEQPLPAPVDIVLSFTNYHDLHGGADGVQSPAASFNKAAYAALKPGGLYVIIDHAGAPGTGKSQTSTLHRIEEATVIAEVTAAGFALVERSDVLRNPADPRTAPVYDPSVKDRTDKLMLKFRKPA